ncbi:hypothetical protein JAAARDRAFT_35059 [Jaapia argillacea MUCL 33604]|uniref:GmrSD restriction endonucleases N-terminal domain-containing protein n=1 Tax=Jaapia argillacea MUCL 33604 TaxID=933084 RepID=A0A067PU27_9AGAM|nr:hypothetical protein JAAARDRAFT_35059 [Jaapia argillacea MUCL 33604]
MESDSDESSLTSMSDGESATPLAQRAAKKTRSGGEYTIKNPLRPYRNTQYTTQSLYDMIHQNGIDLDPEYQRDVVWPEAKQSGLIDSILRNYYLPPIIFAFFSREDGTESRTCIDGKQRLTSIQRFMDGMVRFVLHDDYRGLPYHLNADTSFTGEKFWFKQTGKTRRRLLPKQLVQQFRNKQVVCAEYEGLNGDQEREIFQRVQLGVALTPAERMQALTGPWPTLVRNIQKDILGPEGFGKDFDWNTERGRDYFGVAGVAFVISEHPKMRTPQKDPIAKFLEQSKEPTAEQKADLLDTFRIFVALARDKKYNTPFSKPTRVSPIEFVVIGLLIFIQKSKLSLCQLSSATALMRKDVRAAHKDIRSNNTVMKTLHNFITKKLKLSDLTSDGKGDVPAIRAVKPPVSKRKRVVESGSEDEDRPRPHKSSLASSASRVPKSSQPALPPSSHPPLTTSHPQSRQHTGQPLPSSSSTPTSSFPSQAQIKQNVLSLPKISKKNLSRPTLSSKSEPNSPQILSFASSSANPPPLHSSAEMSRPKASLLERIQPTSGSSSPQPSSTSSFPSISSPYPPSYPPSQHSGQVDRLAPILAAKATIDRTSGPSSYPSRMGTSSQQTHDPRRQPSRDGLGNLHHSYVEDGEIQPSQPPGSGSHLSQYPNQDYVMAESGANSFHFQQNPNNPLHASQQAANGHAHASDSRFNCPPPLTPRAYSQPPHISSSLPPRPSFNPAPPPTFRPLSSAPSSSRGYQMHDERRHLIEGGHGQGGDGRHYSDYHDPRDGNHRGRRDWQERPRDSGWQR